MAILRKLTKCLFGLIDPKTDPPTIVDGEIIQTPKNINVQTHICENTHIHKHTNTQNPIGNGKNPKNTEQIDTCKKFVRRKNPRQLCSSVPEQYFIFLGSAGRAARTIQEYTWDLGWWEQRCKPVDDIALETIEGAINTLQPANARRKIAALRSYAKWQLRNGDDRLFIALSKVVPPRIPIRVPKDKGKAAFKDLSRRAIEMTQNGDRRGIWLGLMLCCGLRISEIQTAKVAPGGAIKVLGKGNKERLVPAPGWLRSALQQSSTDHGQWAKGRKLIWAEMKKMRIRKPHSLRHTYASELVRNDLELEQVKNLLGHAKLDTTLIYARTRLPDDLTTRLGIEA